MPCFSLTCGQKFPINIFPKAFCHVTLALQAWNNFMTHLLEFGKCSNQVKVILYQSYELALKLCVVSLVPYHNLGLQILHVYLPRLGL